MSLMVTRQTRLLIFSGLCSAALLACGSTTTDDNEGAGASSGAGASGAAEAGSPASSGAAGVATGQPNAGGSGGSTVMTGSGGASLAGTGGGMAGTGGGMAGMGGAMAGTGGGMAGASAGSAGLAGSGGSAGAGGAVGAAGSAAMEAGQYSVTLDATTPYALGAEHVGHTVFGTVIDTTPGANRARVGRIQETPVVAGQQVKWVWPKIMIAGHTYELAMFGDDFSKNRTCVVASGTPNPGWIMKIPTPTADFDFPWKRPVTRTDGPECVDFPTGAIPLQ